ncbi:MAG: hypothetical protein M0R03_21680 [Novosphingobium sp.]|nr:hypothetical protein [Novosphingobium sp.]
MLIEPNEKYIERVEGSAHFLNCPKHMLNHTLDCIYLQFHENKKEAIEQIKSYLKSYSIPKPEQQAKEFVEWRSSISMKEFMNLNTNPYVDNTPKHITDMLNHQCEYIESHTTYYPFTGIRKNQPSYPYKYKTL